MPKSPNAADVSTYGPPLDPIAPLRVALRGHYEIEREIGQGAYATVYLARDLKHERKVALKVLNADPASEIGEIRFIREIRVLARLQHPNILPLHDSGHVEALLYYVMPYVEGETLRDRIDRERQLSTEDAVCIAQEVADALFYAHGQGIIHRDIKPENILLSGRHAVVADFGIARAIEFAGVRQLTRTGLGSPGTPAYMAPEQLLGERGIDLRADIYSVGCILYEMLTGKPPFGGKEGFVKRFTEPAPKPSGVATGVPAWVDSIVSTTLARNPAERYENAGLLSRALTLGLARERASPVSIPALPGKDSPAAARQISAPPSAAASPHDEKAASNVGTARVGADESVVRPREALWVVTRRWARSTSGMLTLAAVAVLSVPAAFALSNPDRVRGAFGLNGNPDSTQYAILPLGSDGGASEAIAAHAYDRLYDAFKAWNGLSLLSDMKVDEAVKSVGHPPRTLSEAISVARKLNAGQLVWGHVVRVGASLRPRAELYDLRHPNTSVKEILVRDDTPESYNAAAAALLAIPDRPTAAFGGDGQTHSFAAWTAYNRGHIALAKWNLPGAEAEFTQAVQTDPEFPAARLWLAQIREWRAPLAPDAWRENAERAAGASAAMTERDRLLSVALAAMANRTYPAACGAYRRLAALDSLDFIGWYGIGECQGLDGGVLPDRSSPSGWRWRSSYHTSASAFMRAFGLNSRAHTLLSYQRLRRLLPISAANPRTDDPSSPKFAALPSLITGDTVGYDPYPIAEFAKGLSPGATVTLNQALNRNLEILFTLVGQWVRASPNDPDAFESLSDVLEARGDIREGSDPFASASAAVRKALSLSHSDQQRLRLAVREARLSFKRGDYARMRRIADSLLVHTDRIDRNDPAVLISLTALTGKVAAMAEQATTRIVPETVDGLAVPAALRQIAGDFFARAALGACDESLTALRTQLEQQIQSSVADEQRAKFRAALTTRPLNMMAPCSGAASSLQVSAPTDRMSKVEQAFARRNYDDVKQLLRAIAQSRRAYRPGDVALDYTYQEAWLTAATGDTAGAIAQLDLSLNAIPTMSASALREAGAAAAAGRTMGLRADLAAAVGDWENAKRWAAALAALWTDADPALQPEVRRMKAVASSGR